MLTVTQAKTTVSQYATPLSPARIVLSQASGLVLASDVYSAYDIPGFRQSSMDGYAIKYDKNAKSYELTGEMAAGITTPMNLNQGEAIRIFTGAPLPEDADTVIMQEKISRVDQKISFNTTGVKLGDHVREKGSEIKAGELAMQMGNLLGPAAIGFLAGIGVTEVEVFPNPTIGIILTGNELQKPGKPLSFGQVYESNSYSLTAALENEGLNQINIFNAKDDLQFLTGVLTEALAIHDVILLTGGVSVGEYDFVVQATEKCGIIQRFHKIKQKPGKPLYFGTIGKKLIFGLPGNPSSVMSCYYNYVLPAIKALSKKDNSAKEMFAQLDHEIKKPLGLTHFLKGRYDEGKVQALSAQESYRLRSFAQANCLIVLDEERQEFWAGEMVRIIKLPH